MKSVLPQLLAAAAAVVLSGVSAQSYNSIPDIQVFGQHFFYTNNGSQFLMKGVAYQENYQPNGTSSQNPTNTSYTDPLADAAKCRRDIPVLKEIFTNVIRVYAVDPANNHDDCMEQFAAADIYVIADLGEPGTSIISDTPEWDVTLYQRYTSVVDNLQKYKNVIGFFAGNENVSKDNQTAAAAFVKAAVRDIKGYIKSQNYRSTLGVGYATADVPSRDQLAQYFACEPSSQGNQTAIDFWGYNVYSWCGDSNYQQSQYGERVDFFSDYPVPVFFAEYGCNQNLPGGPMSRPFTEVQVIYGNMTSVFSGGIVYEYFNNANEFGLVAIDGNNNVSPYPDFTSLKKQLATVSPTLTVRTNYTPTNTPPACPSVDSSWAAAASPLPPPVNPQLCSCMANSLQCNVKSTDESGYEATFNYICGRNPKFCDGIARNATTGTYGAYSGCDPKDQLAWAVNQYYLGNNKNAQACDFSGQVTVQAAAATPASCSALLQAAGTAGMGSVPSPTGRGTAGVGPASTGTKSKGVAPGLGRPALMDYGEIIFGIYVAIAVVSLAGIVIL